MDFIKIPVPYRTGDRIRKIREEKGLSRAEFGEMIGLTADRIQQYENGARNPKRDLLNKMAEALDVNPLALMDPSTIDPVGAMFTLFDLENNFHMKIEKTPDDQPPGMYIKAEPSSPMYKYMEEWYEAYKHTQERMKAATSDEEKEEILKLYHNWQWTFPRGHDENISYLVDGITICCGYDFGTDANRAKFCPICGKLLKKPNSGFHL